MSYKKQFIDKIIKIEGGYVNDPDDSGNATNFGITEAVARRFGYKGSMRSMPRSTAFKIYEKMYWHALNLDDVEKLSPSIAQELADTGVNQGTGRAAEFIQRSLNVLNNREKLYNDIKVDNDVGNITIKTLTKYLEIRGEAGELVIFNMLNCLQGAFYVTLAEKREKDEKFINGWFTHRVNIS